MANSNNRCKRDYEDLDNSSRKTFENNIERSSRLSATYGGEQPDFCKSDSAINVILRNPGSLHSPNRYNQSRSIPCFLRQSFNIIEDHHSNMENAKNAETDNLSRYSLKRTENRWLLYFICFYMMYLVLGTLCIKLIEAPIEEHLRTNYGIMRDKFLEKYPHISDDLEEFVKLVLAADDIGVSILEDFQNTTNWNFGHSLFFSTSLVTTIGYGYITPQSALGKTFCIVFSAFGIPLTMFLFSVIVARLLTPTNYLLHKLIEKFGYTENILRLRLLHLLIVATVICTLFIIIPTLVLVNLEQAWTYLDAFYFCFITLTTIGLGDFVPGEHMATDYDSLYEALFSIYMIVGLIGMMLILTVFYNIPEMDIGVIFTTGKWPKRSQETNLPTKSTNNSSNLPSTKA